MRTADDKNYLEWRLAHIIPSRRNVINDKSETEDDNPFENRKVKHQTSDFGAFMHLMRGSMGAGILVSPFSFKNIGLWFGIIAILFVCSICLHCKYMIVKCNHLVCYRYRISKLRLDQLVAVAFLVGPSKTQRYERCMQSIINILLFLNVLGVCCIHLIFVADNIKQLADHHLNRGKLDIRIWIIIITVPLIILCLIRNLKYVVPCSLIANLSLLISVAAIYFHTLTDLPPTSERPFITRLQNWPWFFGTVSFAIEYVHILFPVENQMKNPKHLYQCPSLITIIFLFSILFHTTVGFFGFLKYGDEIQPNITKNFPKSEPLAQLVKLTTTISIYFSFTLLFYVPFNIVWQHLRVKIEEEHEKLTERWLRVMLVMACCGCSIAIPEIGAFVTVLGAFSFSITGLIVPCVVELLVYYNDPGYGILKWRLLKNIVLIHFGLVGLITGTIVSISKNADVSETMM